MINGTFDWVYEEELGLRDGYRWSPNGKSIAYWQLDEEGVPKMHMLNNVSGYYPTLTTFRYPKTGETNAKGTFVKGEAHDIGHVFHTWFQALGINSHDVEFDNGGQPLPIAHDDMDVIPGALA